MKKAVIHSPSSRPSEVTKIIINAMNTMITRTRIPPHIARKIPHRYIGKMNKGLFILGKFMQLGIVPIDAALITKYAEVFLSISKLKFLNKVIVGTPWLLINDTAVDFVTNLNMRIAEEYGLIAFNIEEATLTDAVKALLTLHVLDEIMNNPINLLSTIRGPAFHALVANNTAKLREEVRAWFNYETPVDKALIIAKTTDEVGIENTAYALGISYNMVHRLAWAGHKIQELSSEEKEKLRHCEKATVYSLTTKPETVLNECLGDTYGRPRDFTEDRETPRATFIE